MADATRLRQVIINLLGNAIKFTLAGKVEVGLRASADGKTVRVEVADSGPGVKPEHRDKLFHAFERLNTGARRGVEGAGLGLAISAGLIASMNGTIGYEDNPGGGSLFWLELASCPHVAAPRAPPGAAAADKSERLRVLVADDEAINRGIASSFLQRAGHEVVCVADGVAAVTAAALEDFDVIFMDVRMPGMNGLEATRQIRKLPGTRGKPRIVAVTAQAFAEQIALCREAGMDDHLAKPFKQAMLLAALRPEKAVLRGQGSSFGSSRSREASA
jgi:CheY-like chemotaxis protein